MSQKKNHGGVLHYLKQAMVNTGSRRSLPSTPKRKNKKHMNSANSELLSSPFTNDCVAITGCKSVKRIAMVLHFYFINMNDIQLDSKLLLDYVSKYKNLLNDYQHILLKHLNQEKGANDIYFGIIQAKVNKLINCDIKKCKQFIRLNQNKNKTITVTASSSTTATASYGTPDISGTGTGTGIPITIDQSMSSNNDNDDDSDSDDVNDNDYKSPPPLALNPKDLHNLDDLTNALTVLKPQESVHKHVVNNELSYYLELLDVIHCFFVHSYDSGFKSPVNITKNRSFTTDDVQYKPIASLASDMMNDDNDDNKKDDQIDYDQLCRDDEMIALRDHLSDKRKMYRDLRGLAPAQCNKFCPDITYNNNGSYSFGCRHYYWEWYRDNEQEDILWNRGIQYKDLFINRKYLNFKEELLENLIGSINIYSFNNIYNKCINYFSKSDIISSLQSSTYGYGNCHYNIEDAELIQINHVLSIILYTDLLQISYAYSQIFKHIQSNAIAVDIKKRKSEYWHWIKYMRETVELYGVKLEDSCVKKFYISLSQQIVFNSFRNHFISPTSTSSQLEIALLYACNYNTNGLILELESSTTSILRRNRLKYINCSLFSLYAFEDERLFCGGWTLLQTHTIRMINTNRDYSLFIRALLYFETIINGEYDKKHSEGNKMFEIINKLINGLISSQNNKYPQYINDVFKQFMYNKTTIKFDLQGLNWYYKPFCATILSSICPNLIKFNEMTKLFQNCSAINVKMLLFESMGQLYLTNLRKEITEIVSNPKNKLKKIHLNLVQINVNNAKWKQWELSMNKLNVELQVTDKGHDCYKELLILID